MRILFDSKKEQFKTPFGCVVPMQPVTLHIHIPTSVGTTAVQCVIQTEDGRPCKEVQLSFEKREGPYDIWGGSFSLEQTALVFYWFRITGNTGTFRLFKQGNNTNMEAGEVWQLSCVPADFTTPDWAKGAVIYQVFPDRFYKAGECDLTGKLQPYTVHNNWNEEVVWQPTPKGEVLNNDFYGGNFKGIAEKMDYIASLGVNILYLNPISKSFSSHRYDTGDYKTPDPMLGTEGDFAAMCDAAHARGIRVILDGVFSHTGANSLYFNREGAFDSVGAYNSTQSPYYSWYTFYEHPHKYHSWWDFDTLPTVKKMDAAFVEYIITGEDSVIAHWLNLGADGFRLDVVDELPNAFTRLLKQRLRQIKPDALLIGEVWEDASNKIAYDVRRRYFVDGVLDSPMNYPFRNAVLALLRGHDDGRGFRETVMTILENYPRQVWQCNMNLLGTHDTPRILTALVDEFDGSREQLAERFLSPEDRALAERKLMAASFLQYMLPGAPSTYYGDEVGMEGHKDPFNRRTYPWGSENETLLFHYRSLGRLRKKAALRLGDTEFISAENGRVAFIRSCGQEQLKIYVNLNNEPWQLPAGEVLYAQGLENGSLQQFGFCLMEN